MRTTRLVLTAAAFLAIAGLARAQYGDISDLKLNKPEDKVDAKGTPAPDGAVILFGGKDVENWSRTDGKTPAGWEILEGGVMQVKPGTGNIISKDKFDGSFKLHVEFRVPYLPDKHGQERGNSGVYVQGRYAYLSDNSTTNAFEIWDVSNPAAPVRVSQSTLNQTGRGIYVQGRYAYLADQSTSNAFEVWDISNTGSIKPW